MKTVICYFSGIFDEKSDVFFGNVDKFNASL